MLRGLAAQGEHYTDTADLAATMGKKTFGQSLEQRACTAAHQRIDMSGLRHSRALSGGKIVIFGREHLSANCVSLGSSFA